MHSHPSSGWQDMSEPDVRAERDRIADTARATGKPLVGMTVGTDGYWSARFWEHAKGRRTCQWCRKVRVLHKTRLAVWRRPDDNQRDRRRQRRTVDSWGERKQRDLEALRIGVVGVGSVGSVVAEGLARVGVREFVLIDHDVVEEHNLDRLLNAHRKDIGRLKTDVAEDAIRAASTADGVVVANYPRKIQHREAYAAARDCDILVSCVDSPMARDVLNRIAHRVRHSRRGRRRGCTKGTRQREHERRAVEGACRRSVHGVPPMQAPIYIQRRHAGARRLLEQPKLHQGRQRSRTSVGERLLPELGNRQRAIEHGAALGCCGRMVASTMRP